MYRVSIEITNSFHVAVRLFSIYLTIRPVAKLDPWGEAEWAIDPRPLRAKGLIVLVSPN